MNKEELKKKIGEELNKIQDYGYMCRVTYNESTGTGSGISHQVTNDNIADALIAAGIGDVKEAEHRAEVAERALLTVCTNVIKDEEDDIAIEPRARVLYKAYLSQAKKELAEERKDEQD